MSQASSSRQTMIDPILSPLHSSSSSSGTEIGESYINFGAIPDTTDPFSRFWGMLDNMLDDISNPVAFASAPIEAAPLSAQEVLDTAKRKERTKSRKSKGKGATTRSETCRRVILTSIRQGRWGRGRRVVLSCQQRWTISFA